MQGASADVRGLHVVCPGLGVGACEEGPAQQLQAASTKKEKSSKLTEALRNACASMCAGVQLELSECSPQAAAVDPVLPPVPA